MPKDTPKKPSAQKPSAQRNVPKNTPGNIARRRDDYYRAKDEEDRRLADFRDEEPTSGGPEGSYSGRYVTFEDLPRDVQINTLVEEMREKIKHKDQIVKDEEKKLLGRKDNEHPLIDSACKKLARAQLDHGAEVTAMSADDIVDQLISTMQAIHKNSAKKQR